MTVGQFLASATQTLQQASSSTPRLDCLILLEDVLDRDRALLLAHPEAVLSAPQRATLNKKITQRSQGTPLAYIRGRAAFYGRDFAVSQDVLVPRPETETMVDMLKTCALGKHPIIADVGTGSGCIGITAALELPTANVILYDNSPTALRIAAQNSQLYSVKNIRIVQQDLLSGDNPGFDVILANLPYVPTDYPINQSASHEPKGALFSGIDGLDHYRAFWEQVTTQSKRPAHIFTESLPQQHQALATLAKQAGYKLAASQYLIQHFTIA